METAVNRHFAIALKELRSAVTWCCWLLGLALAVQVVAWSLLTYTDMRYTRIVERADEHATTIVTPEERRRQSIREAASVEADPDVEPADVNRQYSSQDRILGLAVGVAGAAGTMGTLALLPLLGLGVVLAAGSATRGVDRAAGAFVWAVVLVMITLPWGLVFEALPFDGLFVSYATLTSEVEAARGITLGGEAEPTGGGILFYGRYLILPVAGMAGITAIGLRFRAGVEEGLLPRENFRLDPQLEKEVAKIKPGSLVGGGRTAGALQSTITRNDEPAPGRSIRQVSPGEPLKRLI
ncbi:MAG: hypothetical protein HRU76_11825 [Phycisphaeraceae bacterium]|nr:MAG: hypothetical protein HRU76_11825 [Phycisphaeraceae bacterium]